MDWQQLVALSIVAVTAAIFARQLLRPKKLLRQANSPCGCESRHEGGDKTRVIYRARKGQRPQIIVKSS